MALSLRVTSSARVTCFHSGIHSHFHSSLHAYTIDDCVRIIVFCAFRLWVGTSIRFIFSVIHDTILLHCDFLGRLITTAPHVLSRR